MSIQIWTWILVGVTFSLYIGIAIWSRAGSTKEFYVAGGGRISIGKWISYCGRLDVRSFIYFHGGNHFL